MIPNPPARPLPIAVPAVGAASSAGKKGNPDSCERDAVRIVGAWVSFYYHGKHHGK